MIDGAVVGKTPWEGALAPGPHTVFLAGDGDIGTPPIQTTVKVNEVVTVDLLSESLPGEIKITPQPSSAEVFVDDVPVGRGPWKGRLRRGPHKALVRLDGYAPYTLEFTLGDKLSDLDVHLQPAVEPSHARVSLELDASAAFGLLWGGDLSSGCTGSCSSSLPIGFDGVFHGTYTFGSGFGLGVHAGYLLLTRSIDGRASEIASNSRLSSGTVKDTLRLGGFAVGADAQLELGEVWPVTLRLGVGALIGSIRDSRTGAFTDTKGGAYSVDTAQSGAATYIYVAPEARFGRRFGEHFELNVGAQLLVLAALATPSWDGTKTVSSGADGIGTFPKQSLAGSLLLDVNPGIGAKYEF
ncbi:MAG: PEGA domain-containing protein [Polyangiaceae bacterium]